MGNLQGTVAKGQRILTVATKITASKPILWTPPESKTQLHMFAALKYIAAAIAEPFDCNF